MDSCKGDPDVDWYSFETTELNGTTDLKIIVQENKSSAVRKATFTIESKSVLGVESVKSTIVLKQSNNNTPEVYQFDAGEIARWTVNGTAPIVVMVMMHHLQQRVAIAVCFVMALDQDFMNSR